MKHLWLKFLLLATFVFWASGVAKYAHEAMEHHGRDASVDDDDDDDAAPVAVSQSASPVKKQVPAPVKHACPVCQMLAAMMVDRSTPPVSPSQSTQLIATLTLSDRIAPILHACFARSARDPPRSCISDLI